ncbi:IQ domain-containing protein C isoform X4 [Coturnix japonica]|uniref:IQ domain-containing protein C isoform X4 n=1 Tax=Coturnix japonica TaxID=93934 RepID=UPI000777CF16|nr:IQ domain-containing protein C isoform X4 [Coturnix japonica]
MAVTRGHRAAPPLNPPPSWSAAHSGAVTSSERAVTSSGGAPPVAPDAMAAVSGPRDEAEERRLLRAVTRLQAAVRGFLLRRTMRDVRAEYEQLVLDVEGERGRLRWTGRYLRTPVFLPEPVKEKCSALQEAVSSHKGSTEKTQQELDVLKPERDWGSSNSMKHVAQLQSEKELSSMGECNGANPPNLGAVAGKSTEKRRSVPAQSKEWQNTSSVSSVWDSTDLEPGSLNACMEIPHVDLKELPRTRPGLQSFRNHLIMELLWLQQAIDSRKNYLKLKQRLESPDC